MKKRMAHSNRALRNILVNALIIAVIASLYLVTNENSSVEVMAVLNAGPSYRGKSDDAVALEFAVSWNASEIDSILDTLLSHNVCATFAVTGEYASKNPETLVRMVSEGHELATMGYSREIDEGYKASYEDVKKSVEVIEDISKKAPSIYYSGDRSIANAARTARKLGLKHVLCTVDLRSAAGSAEDIIERGLNELRTGSIILVEPTLALSAALSGLLEGIEAAGMRTVRVSDILP